MVRGWPCSSAIFEVSALDSIELFVYLYGWESSKRGK